MLGDREALATIAVRDINIAARFYEGTLRPEAGSDEGEGSAGLRELEFSNVLVYTSQFAGTNKATAITWMVGGDIEKVVRI